MEEENDILFLFKKFLKFIRQGIYLNDLIELKKNLAPYEAKNKEELFWLDVIQFLETIHRKKKVNKQIIKIIEKIIANDKLDLNIFLKYYMKYFILGPFLIDFKEGKSISKINNNKSKFFDILFDSVLPKDEKISDYKYILNKEQEINNFYDKYSNDIYEYFLKSCIISIDNLVSDKNLSYYIKFLDFVKNIKITNKYPFYEPIKNIFFDIKNKIIVLRLDEYLKNYKDIKDIKNNIKYFLNCKYINDNDYEYIKFLKNYIGLDLNKKDINTSLIFLKYLNEDILLNYINENNINLKKLSIFNNNCNNINKINSDNIIIRELDIDSFFQNNNVNNKKNDFENNNNNNNNNNNQIYDDFDSNILNIEENDESIKYLKQNLTNYTIKEYLIAQKNKYFKEMALENNMYLLKEISDKSSPNIICEYFSSLKLTSNYPLIDLIYIHLLENIRNINANYPGKNFFGIVVIDKREYIYTYHNQQIFENFLFNANKIKPLDYQIYLDEEGENKNSVTSSELSSKSRSRGNKDMTSIKEEFENIQFDFNHFKGADFEMNTNNILKDLLELVELPNYFFALKKKDIFLKKEKLQRFEKKENNQAPEKNGKNYSSLIEYINNIFSRFIETDGAFLYLNDKNINDRKTAQYIPLIVQKTFEIKKILKNDKFEFIINNLEENIKPEPKTIILTETKFKMPKDIKNFSILEKFEKNKLAGTLIFTLFKLIQKIEIYKKYIKNEILNENENINDYKFKLILIYDVNLIKDISEFIKKDLEILIQADKIKSEFKLQIIYFPPTLSSYNVFRLQKNLDEITKKFEINLKNKDKEIRDIKNELAKKNEEIDYIKQQIQQLQKNKISKEEMINVGNIKIKENKNEFLGKNEESKEQNNQGCLKGDIS